MTAQDIRNKCDNDIKRLQEECQHPTSQWALEAWAPAHFTGREIRYCTVCEKHLETKEPTWEPIQSTHFSPDDTGNVPLTDIIN